MDDMYEDQAPHAAPLSWRDVGRMVNDSEVRLTKRIDEWGNRVTAVMADHETRLSVEEDFTIGLKTSASTAERFFSFGRWVLATAIAICGVAIAAIARLGN